MLDAIRICQADEPTSRPPYRDLKQENQRLEHQVNSLKNDPKTIEKEAREQLRYARPGEVIYTLPQSAQKPATITAAKH